MDMLVKLYALPDISDLRQQLAQEDILVRRAMAYEMKQVVAWVSSQFGEAARGWQSECEISFSRSPIACQIATQGNRLFGFACHDATAKNFFGPIGVAKEKRLCGLGSLLLVSALESMREQGYAYAIIGYAGAGEFFEKTVGAIAIPESETGIYPLGGLS